jgi:hypothetical protein
LRLEEQTKEVCFVGMIKEDGIEIGGKVYSRSIAAFHCIQIISPSRMLPN